MFSRAAVNPLDDAVAKATDENITTENWELILNVCDRVDADNENGAKNAINSIQKRLGHRNANVQLYSLSLAEALSKNCGSKVHRELSSRAFTQSLLRLVNDRTIHAKVKSRIGELVKQWTEDFKRDPSLGVMGETYKQLKSQGISTDPPSRPQKREMTDANRRQEEEELQMALAMSLSDAKISAGSSSGRSGDSKRVEVDSGPNAYTLPTSSSNLAYSLPQASHSGYVAQQQQPQQQLQQTPVAERSAATVSRVRGLYDFTASEAGELTFRRGDVITVIESAYQDWWRGSLHGAIGIFPTNYVENMPEPTPADLQRESEEELKVFSEAKNVEKLLSILSTAEPNDPSIAENEQLQNLYHTTLSIRPKLVRLIEKYSRKKDDLIMLNEKFMKARKDYDELMEVSLSRYQTSNHYPPANAYAPRIGQQAVREGRVSSGYPQDTHQARNPQAAQQIQRPQRTGSASDLGIQQQRPLHTGHPAHYQQERPQGQRIASSTAQAPYREPQHSGRHKALPSDPYHSSQPGAVQGQMQGQVLHTIDPSMPPAGRSVSVGYTQEPGAASSGTYPTPTSPSQELSQAFPTTLQPSSFTPADAIATAPMYTNAGARNGSVGTYNHARAEREGGPPIAYYQPAQSQSQSHAHDAPRRPGPHETQHSYGSAGGDGPGTVDGREDGDEYDHVESVPRYEPPVIPGTHQAGSYSAGVGIGTGTGTGTGTESDPADYYRRSNDHDE